MQPGDVLLVALADDATEAEAADIKKQIEPALPGVRVVLLTGVTALAVYRGSEE